MKKVLFIILGVIFIAGSITVAAQFSDSAKNIDAEASITDTEDIYATYDKPQVYEYVQISDKKVDAVFQLLNRSGKSKKEIYDDVYMYKFFLKMYNPTNVERAYVDALILKGADVTVVVGIFDFWRTTAESIDMIGKIYDLSGGSTDPFWIEEAFNGLTENRHGVLDVKIIHEYFEKGLTKEDISLANMLCRKGVYTITEILDKVVEGESWTDIAVYITQNVSGNLHIDNIDRMRTSEYVESTADIAEYIRIAEMSGENPDIYLADAELKQEAVTIQDASEALRLNISNEIRLEMLADSIIVREELTEAGEYFIAETIANGVSEEEVDQLLDNGYSAIDIYNASVESMTSDEDVQTILTKQRSSLLEGMGGVLR